MKKIIAILLAVLLLASVATFAVSAYSTSDDDVQTVSEAVKAYEEENGVEIETYRYYYLQPNGRTGFIGKDPEGPCYEKFADSWEFPGFTDGGSGIYWWDQADVPNPGGWVGYKCDGKLDGCNVWYADVPSTVTTILWNNGVDGGMDTTQEIYYKAMQSNNVGAEYYDPGESPYIEHTDNFNNMIWVCNPDAIEINVLSQKQTCPGYWFYYYGGECYGADPNGADDLDNCCMNEAHTPGHHDPEPEPTVLRGDANMDGMVDVKDAVCIQKWCANLIGDDKIDKAAADADQDGIVDVKDATRIQKWAAQLCNMDGSKPYDPDNPSNPKW